MAVGVLSFLVGGLLIIGTLADALTALLVPRGATGRLRPTRMFYRVTWVVWRGLARRLKAVRPRETVLSLYGPLSLLTLLSLWLLGLLVGWALVFWPLRAGIDGITGYGSIIYYSGTALLTVGFGDITAETTLVRLLTLLTAVTGLGTIALVVSYLPALYGAYSRREARILTLDDPSGDQLHPSTLIGLQAPDGDLIRLYDYLTAWELWTAEVLESHVSYPMLAFFRSQHDGMSWVAAMGVMADTAALLSAIVPGAELREPYFLYRRARRTLVETYLRLRGEVEPGPTVVKHEFQAAYDRIVELGLPTRPADEAWERFTEYRATYGPTLNHLLDFLALPPGFWGHSSEDAEDDIEPEMDPEPAQMRPR